MKTKFFIPAIAILLLFSGCSSSDKKTDAAIQSGESKPAAQDTLAVSTEALHSNVQAQSDVEASKIEKELTQEAVTALQKTKDAVKALEMNETEEAYKHLEAALGKLEVLLTREPDLQVVPVDSRVEVFELNIDPDAIEASRRTVKQLVKEGKLQAARSILDNLVDEIKISTYQLPLATYPKAIKLAIKFLDQGKKEQAQKVLEEALSTLVVTETSIPIPVVNAQLMVNMAADSVESNNELALKLLREAQQQLTLAETLGYGDRDHEFSEIDKDIETLKEKINKKEKSSDLFDSLKVRIRKFKERIS